MLIEDYCYLDRCEELEKSREHVLDSPGVDKVPGDPGDGHHALEGGVHQEQVGRGRGLAEALLERGPGQVNQGQDDGLSLTRSLTWTRGQEAETRGHDRDGGHLPSWLTRHGDVVTTVSDDCLQPLLLISLYLQRI